ncbi:MAG: CNNM domain-containing protein [Planctomycetota bacterium]|nr:CNNM domain-containing protein [Planctomycetota bacterium]
MPPLPESSGISSLAWLLAPAALIGMLFLSALFSASEAALFSLTSAQRLKLDSARRSDRAIQHLLSNPSHLLTCILLCNLAINITFFACANVLSNSLTGSEAAAFLFAFATVTSVILFGELLPKSVGVLAPLKISRFIAIPMLGIMRAVLPLGKGMHAINDICRRLIWPGLVPESVLETSDLERAIELSETDSKMIDLEKGILQNTLQLSNIQAQEWMHPKSQFASISLPATTEELEEWIVDQGTEWVEESKRRIALILSPSDNEVTATTTIDQLRLAIEKKTPPTFQPAYFIPWCANLASVLQQLMKLELKVAVVVNERGDTIGVLFFEDIIEAIFASPSAAINAMGRPLFAKTGEAKWEVTGATRIKQLERSLGIKLPETRDATIAGVLQSQLRRLAQVGDHVAWGTFTLQVTEIPRRGEMFVQITSSEIDIAEDESGGIE